MVRILVIEDDELLLHMYDSIFTANNFKVSVANNGEIALAVLMAERPDIILMDVVMPKIDGLTLLKEMKDRRDVADIPVIVITSLTDTATASQALKLGAARFLLKSEHRPQDVVSVVHDVLKPKPAGQTKHD